MVGQDVTKETVSAPKKQHQPTKEDLLVQARRDRYQRHDPCQQQTTADMWTDKSHLLSTEYKQHFRTPLQHESGEIAGVPARLIKNTGKSMPKPIERPE